MIIDPIISKNVALIKDANGKDIERIYDRSGNLVFKNWKTLEGPLPIECFTSSNKLRNYRIYGNTIQDGTPELENPVDVQGCGEQTENLFDKDTAVVYHAYITGGGKWFYATDSTSVRIRVKPNTQYTLSTEGTYKIFRILEVQSDDIPTEQNEYPQIPSILIMRGEDQSHCTFKTSKNAKYIVFQSNISVVNKWLSELMLVEGNSIRSDYIPYGYKIPVTVNGINLFDVKSFINPNNTTENAPYFVKSTARYAFSFPVDIGETYILSFYTQNIEEVPARLDYCVCYGRQIGYSQKNNNLSIRTKNAKDVWRIATITFTAMGDWISIQGSNNYFKEIMLIKGSVIPDYEPYHEPITTPVYIGSEPLHKIGDYADYIDFKRGVVVRHIKKAVLTGDENWINDVHDANHDVYRTENFANFRTWTTSVGDVGIFRCNQILYMQPPYPSGLYDRIVLFDDNVHQHTLYFSTKKSIGIDTVDKFKAFLSAQYEAGTPVTVWYVLAEPEEEVLSLSQKIPTNIGSNTFSCTISPAPSKAMIQYKKK